MQFNSVLLKVSSLNEWIDIGGFKDFENEEVFSIKHKSPEPITFYETDVINFVFLFQRTAPLFRPRHSCTVVQDTVILIKHTATFDLDTFWEYISVIKSFLTLAYFAEPQIQQIQLKQGEKILDLIYVGQRKDTIQEKSHRRHFLFSYKMIADNFVSVFQKWAELNILMEPVIDVLQESFGNRNIINENKFLNIMQGIETFHRRRRQNQKEPKDIHMNKVSEIVNSCPENYKIWLKEKLNFSNEPTLSDRLEQLFNELDITLRKHLFPDPEKIILQSKNSRNYYTHYDKTLEKKALKDSELFYLTERLKIFLLILLLKETAISDNEVNTIIKEGSEYLFNHLIVKTPKAEVS